MEGDINAPTSALGEIKHQSPPKSPGITGGGVPTVPVSAANNPAPGKEPPTTVAKTAVIPSVPVIRRLVSLSAVLRARDDLEDAWDRGMSVMLLLFSAAAPALADMEIPHKPSRRLLTQPPPARLINPCGPRPRRDFSRRLEALEALPVLRRACRFLRWKTAPWTRSLCRPGDF